MAISLVTLLALVPMLAGCLGAVNSAERTSSIAIQKVSCPSGSEWPQTADAAWLRGVLARDRFLITECTGSAYTIRFRRGQQVYVWAFSPVHGGRELDAEETAWIREVAGTPVYGNDIRAVWIADGRYVWVGAGPTAAALPPTDELAPLVRATLR